MSKSSNTATVAFPTLDDPELNVHWKKVPHYRTELGWRASLLRSEMPYGEDLDIHYEWDPAYRTACGLVDLYAERVAEATGVSYDEALASITADSLPRLWWAIEGDWLLYADLFVSEACDDGWLGVDLVAAGGFLLAERLRTGEPLADAARSRIAELDRRLTDSLKRQTRYAVDMGLFCSVPRRDLWHLRECLQEWCPVWEQEAVVAALADDRGRLDRVNGCLQVSRLVLDGLIEEFKPL